MGWETGLLEGFLGRKGEVESQRLKEAQTQSENEGKVFQALLASPDEHVRSLALTGLLTSASGPKRKGGLKGWMGETEGNPIFSQIKTYAQTPQTSTRQEVVPQTPFKVPQGGAALPAKSPVEVGGPPVNLATTQGAMPQPEPSVTPPPKYRSVTETKLPKMLLSPEESYRQQQLTKASADVEGEQQGLVSAGFTPDESRSLVKESYMRRATGGVGAAPYQSIPGELPDGTTTYGTFNRATGQYEDQQKRPIPGFRPRTTTGSTSMGALYERAARELGFASGAAVRNPADVARVNDRADQLAASNASATTTARGEANADVPLNTQQAYQATTGLQADWRKVDAPQREMQRQLQLMQTGLQRFKEGDKIGGAQAVLVTFQKILDPSSVVRESEYDRSPEGLSLKARIEGYFERLKAGGAGVPEADLAAMVETANQFTQGMTNWNAGEKDRIERTAKLYKIDPSLIFGGASPTPSVTAPPSAAPRSAAPGPEWEMRGGQLYHNGQPF